MDKFNMQFRENLVSEMKKTFGKDQRRINHALSVLKYAEEILEGEKADRLTVTAAAILHDIGIQEAERKHNSSAPRFQELEGPPIAREILQRLGFDEKLVEHVCRIVGSHHSAKDIDDPEFRIVWDADLLVNVPDEHANLKGDEMKSFISKVFRTDSGRRIANEAFLE